MKDKMKPQKEPSLPDYLAAGEIIGQPLIYYKDCDSTNVIALDLGRSGAISGTIILADQQHGGRGRLGKNWFSPPGTGLYFSIILRPQLELAQLARLTLTSGLALAQAADLHCGTIANLKWPNDLLLGGKKCGGILVETDLSQALPLVVVGIGVNVYQPLAGFSPAIGQRAGAWQDFIAEPLCRGKIFKTIITCFNRGLQKLEAGEWPKICQQWQQRDATLGQECTWLTAANEIIKGVSEGIDDHGQLYIRDEHGQLHAVLSGDVQLNKGAHNALIST